MPRRIPPLGYRSRTEAVMALQRQGLPDRLIAEKIGIKVSTVQTLGYTGMRSAARRGEPIDSASLRQARAEAQDRRTVVFYAEPLEMLRPEAEARQLHINELVRLLIDRIVDDKLVGAILDDANE